MADPKFFDVSASAIVAENHASRMFGCAGLYWPRHPEKHTQRVTPEQLEILRAEAKSKRRRIAISKIVPLDADGKPLGDAETPEGDSPSLSIQLDEAVAEIKRRGELLDAAHEKIDALTTELNALKREAAGETVKAESKPRNAR